MTRQLTDIEKRDAGRWWPNMNVDRVVVSGERTQRYNCLSWTLGVTYCWVWPWGDRDATKPEFDALYRSHGFYADSNGTVSVFGAGTQAMMHGSIHGRGHGPRWESKCGSWLRIQHGLGEMEGGGYGAVKERYTKNLYLVDTQTQTTIEEAQTMSVISKNEKELVIGLTRSCDAAHRRTFEEAYAKWAKTWDDPACAMSSDPRDYAKSPEFRNLIALGKDIVPLLMEKLADPDKFLALQAVEYLAQPEVIAKFELDDPAVLEGEQERAAQTVRKWLALEA